MKGFLVENRGDAINPLIGNAPEIKLVDEIGKKILSYESVYGFHDLMVHDYGSNRRFASVHVEIPASQDILLSHEIIDEIEQDFMQNMGVQMVIHFDPLVTDNPSMEIWRARTAVIATDIDPDLSIHDFRMVEGQRHTNLIFDVLVSPHYKISDRTLWEIFDEKVGGIDPSCSAVVTIDRNYIRS